MAKRKKDRDYAADYRRLRAARTLLGDVAATLASTGAMQTRLKVRAAIKSCDGAIRHADGHRRAQA